MKYRTPRSVRFESRLEQLNSLILRHSGAVIGWVAH